MKDYDRDTFWNIDSLVPKTKKHSVRPLEKKRLVDYFVDEDGDANNPNLSIDKIDNARVLKRETLDYSPRHSLIKRVIVEHIPDKVDFHANFTRAAHLYFDTAGDVCDYVPFYSYMPRYPQLNEKQKRYYFYFRDRVRVGEYPKCDKSYLDLLAYEIINLPDLMSADEGISQLIGLWCAYRDRFPMMDESFATWIADYCFIHQIDCPMDKLSGFIYKILSKLPFKEFFLSDIQLENDEGIDAILYCLSDYSWKSGRYANEENKEIYKKHLIGAMRRIIIHLNNKNALFDGDEVVTLERRAFQGATVSSIVKCKINVEYTPFVVKDEIRKIITNSVKYCENKLRMLMGVKSRLAIKGLDDEYKEIIDEYFRLLIERANQLKARAARPEYEELYEAENTVISFDDAESIERDSWITTARLVENVDEAFIEETDTSPDEIEKPECEVVDLPCQKEEIITTTNDSDDILSNFVRAALKGDYQLMKNIALGSGELIDTIVERVNELFLSIIGDVIFENSDDGYSIIEDYKEDIENWLLTM